MGRIVNALKPPMAMVLLQLIFAVINVMYKLAANEGMNLKIIIAYRFMFATVVMLPFTVVFERTSFARINLRIMFQAFMCGLLGGSLGQNLYLQSLVLTSATFASAMINLMPAMTYILTICFKMEKLAIETAAGKIKALGTLVGIGGAMVLTFYRGLEINWSTNVNLLHNYKQSIKAHDHIHTGKFVLGAFLGFLSCLSITLWLIVQAKMSLQFPYLYTSTALMCFMGSIQGSLVAICTEKDWSQWKLGWDIRLLTVSSTGILGNALTVFLVSWGVQLKGPLYASIFNPLGLLFVAIVGTLVLEEKLHLGSIIGGIFIVCGIYLVLWGKSKEIKAESLPLPTTTINKNSEGKDQNVKNESQAQESIPDTIILT